MRDDDLLNFGNHLDIYADGLAEVQFLGANARQVFFTWHKTDGVFRRMIAVTIVRPVSGLGTDTEMIMAAKEQPRPTMDFDAARLQ